MTILSASPRGFTKRADFLDRIDEQVRSLCESHENYLARFEAFQAEWKDWLALWAASV